LHAVQKTLTAANSITLHTSPFLLYTYKQLLYESILLMSFLMRL
jgi:hypothetical protein